MKISCERCGREIGFFSRAHELKNVNLNIEYSNLCSKCNSLLTNAISKIDAMAQSIRKALLNDYKFSNLVSVDLDTIIFLSIDAVLRINPSFSDPSDALYQVFIGENSENIYSEKELLSKMIKKILDYGFSANLENAELLSYSKYFSNTVLSIKQIQANCSQNVPQTWIDLLLTKRGVVLRQTEGGQITRVNFPFNEEIKYSLKKQDGLQSIQFSNVKYPESLFKDRNVVLYSNDDNQLQQITKLVDYFNEQLKEKEDQKRRLILNQIGEQVRNDLRKIFSDTPISTLHVDSVLLIIMKNIKRRKEIPVLDIYNPYGVIVDLLIRDYLTNFLTLGIRTRDEIVEYIQDHCLYTEECNIKLPALKSDHMWGFFTSRGYILFLKKAKKYLFVFEKNYPNDIYYPLNNLLYQGIRYIQIPDKYHHLSNKNEQNGVILYSKKIEIVDEMNRFFTKNNCDFQMDFYMEKRNEIFTDRDQILELKRACDKLFAVFGYIPFCMYDEWFTIYQEIIKDSPFLERLFSDQSSTVNQYNHHTIYTKRITHAFDKGATDLMKTLKIDDIDIAKGLMLEYLNQALIDLLSQEWVRINGDEINANTSLEQAFDYYLNLKKIEPQKAYYFGLFVYYLMNKGVLSKKYNFFENYQRSMAVFLRCQQNLEYDTGIEIPSEMLESDSETEVNETTKE